MGAGKRPMFKRGAIYDFDLGEENIRGSEQRGSRPCVIIQNDTGNTYSSTVIVVAISKKPKTLPTHVTVDLREGSTVMTEQIKTIDKSRAGAFIRMLDSMEMFEVDRALEISLGLV